MAYKAPDAATAKRAVPVSAQTRSSSLTDLLTAVVRLLPLQIKDELALALGQAKGKGVKVGVGAGLAVVGLFFLALLVISLVVALIGAFTGWAPLWASALWVSLAFFVLAVLLIVIGAVVIKGAMPLVPEETVRNIEHDLGYLKEGNAFDPDEYDRLKAERAEEKRIEKEREAERRKAEKKADKKARKQGQAARYPLPEDASEEEIRRRADLRRRHLGDIRSGLEERASVKGQLNAFTSQMKAGRGGADDAAQATDPTAPYSGAARAGVKAGDANEYVKERWQPLALLGASGTALAVLLKSLGSKK